MLYLTTLNPDDCTKPLHRTAALSTFKEYTVTVCFNVRASQLELFALYALKEGMLVILHASEIVMSDTHELQHSVASLKQEDKVGTQT